MKAVDLQEDPNITQVHAAVEDVIRRLAREKWRRAFAAETPSVFRWVATLTGRILFAEGGEQNPDSFVGKVMGKDFGENPEFFAAVERLTAPDGPDTIKQLARGAEDNPSFQGHSYLNIYTLVRLPSGRAFAVAVTSIDLADTRVEAGYCGMHRRQCPLLE